MKKEQELRVSMRSGRCGSPAHNDRSFLLGKSKEEMMETAPHIRGAERNIYVTWDNQENFRESELSYYRMRYASACEKTNEHYRKNRHPERCITPDDVYVMKQKRPEEMILQIGNMHSNINFDDFIGCVDDYVSRLQTWNEETGWHMKILNIAIHDDEASPHCHIRRVWEYLDKDGVVQLGQDKALEAMGIEPPDPQKKPGRYNHRKMTFDRLARELWQQVCREHGYDIETVPRPRARHKQKAEYISEQIQKDIDQKNIEKDQLNTEIQELQKDIQGIRKNKNIIAARVSILSEAEVEALNANVKKVPIANKVILQKDEYERLIKTAAAAEIAVAKTENIIAERDAILEDAKNKTESLVASARLECEGIIEEAERRLHDGRNCQELLEQIGSGSETMDLEPVRIQLCRQIYALLNYEGKDKNGRKNPRWISPTRLFTEISAYLTDRMRELPKEALPGAARDLLREEYRYREHMQNIDEIRQRGMDMDLSR